MVAFAPTNTTATATAIRRRRRARATATTAAASRTNGSGLQSLATNLASPSTRGRCSPANPLKID